MGIRVIYKLDAEPLSQWMNERAIYYGGIKVLSDKIEENYVWVGKFINHEFKTVDLDKADSILCKDGTLHLRELYPNLYEE